jgi:hypothetical protein
VPSEGEGILKHAQQFQKQAGGVLLQERSPGGSSFDMNLEDLLTGEIYA